MGKSRKIRIRKRLTDFANSLEFVSELTKTRTPRTEKTRRS